MVVRSRRTTAHTKSWSIALISLGLTASASCRADDSVSIASLNGDRVVVYAAGSETYESNIFRLPENAELHGRTLPFGYSRSDSYRSTGGGLEAVFTWSRQTIRLDGTIARLNYDRNSFLNHTAGRDALSWNWVAGATFSGTVSAGYSRDIADFVNNHLIARDTIDRTDDMATLRWAAAAHLAIYMTANTTRTSHGIDAQKHQDNRTHHYSSRVDYVFGAENTLGLVYSEARANFSDSALIYRDQSTYARLYYAVSSITDITVDGGWDHRTYEHTARANFSGGVAHLQIAWQPTPVTKVSLKGARELNAYLNNESDYYVTTAASVAISWNPTPAWSIDLVGTAERQMFKSSGLGILAVNREDQVRSTALDATWSPCRGLEISLAYGFEDRRSTDDYFNYSSSVARGKLRLLW